MRKENKCKHCGSSFGDKYNCDTCGDNLITKYIGVPIIVSFGYNSNLDGEEYHFCNYRCLLDFILAEMKKLNPLNKDLEFGKKKENKK